MRAGYTIKATGAEEVKRNILSVVKNFKGDLDNALGKACMNLLMKAINDLPEAPVDTAALISSGSVLVNNKLYGTSPYIGGNARIISSLERGYDRNVAIVGNIIFGVDYALKVHSGEVHLRSKNAGPGFLSKKLDEQVIKDIGSRVRLRL